MKRLPHLLILAASFVGVACADSIQLSLDPTSGLIQVSPGQVGGWGFSLVWNSTSDWLSVTGSVLAGQSNSSLISQYTDFIGMQGGPTNFAVAPNTTWTEATFNAASQLGTGSVQLNPADPIFAEDAGNIMIFYSIYSSEPTASTTPISSSVVSVPFTIEVVAPSSAPEPSSISLLGFGTLCFLLIAGRKFFSALKRGKFRESNDCFPV